jgi:hypothetical protein
VKGQGTREGMEGWVWSKYVACVVWKRHSTAPHVQWMHANPKLSTRKPIHYLLALVQESMPVPWQVHYSCRSSFTW